eukprot:9977127-Alexandrium_andersonii.AAC.1
MAANSSAWRESASTVIPASVRRKTRFRHRVSWRSPAAAPPPSRPTTFRRAVLLSSRATRSNAPRPPANAKSPPWTNPMGRRAER